MSSMKRDKKAENGHSNAVAKKTSEFLVGGLASLVITG